MHSVGLGNVNGVTLGYQEGARRRQRQTTRTAAVHDHRLSDGCRHGQPMQPVTKPFEIEVTCPSR